MLTETGRVVAIDKDSLWIETIRQTVCGTCAAQKGCGHGLLNQIGDGRRSYLQVSSAAFPGQQFQLDDEVSIGIPEELLVRGSALVYLTPLLSMLALAALAPILYPSTGELGAVLAAAMGFALGAGLVRIHAYLQRDNRKLQAQLLGHASTH